MNNEKERIAILSHVKIEFEDFSDDVTYKLYFQGPSIRNMGELVKLVYKEPQKLIKVKELESDQLCEIFDILEAYEFDCNTAKKVCGLEEV